MKAGRAISVLALGLGLTLACLWLLGIGPLPVARAAPPIVVENIDASGPGSLRQAIIDANGSVGHDTITFAAGLNGTVFLTASLPTIDDDLTITGPGASLLSISGDNTYRVLLISSGKAVTITGVTIRNGHTATDGGGISNYGTLRLADTDVVSNTAGDEGGGVWVCSGGSATLIGVRIISNTANDSGGGLGVYEASAVVSETEIISNTANNSGGGLYVRDATVVVSDTQIISNTADRGGGVALTGSDAEFTQTEMTVIAHNRASLRGGGVYVGTGSATLSGGQIADNVVSTAGSEYGGGGVYVHSGSATLSGAEIVSNTAPRGGGVYIYEGDATLSGGQIVSNTAWGNSTSYDGGGGVYVHQDGAIFAQTGVSTITHNTAARNGGGIYVQDGSALLEHGKVISNTAGYYGGGVYVYDGSVSLGEGGQIVDNSADDYGGGMFIYQGDAELEGGLIQGNATETSGGGVCNYNGDVTLSAGQILSNTAKTYGGGVYVSLANAAFTQTGVSTITHNSAARGGGVYVAWGSAVLNGGQIISNTAKGTSCTFDGGGGVYAYGSSATFAQTGGRMVDNFAACYGGGVYAYQGSATLSGGQIISNTATHGGGVYVREGDATLNGTGQIVGNTAAAGAGAGGGVHVAMVSAAFTQTGDSTIANNTASYGGGVCLVGHVTLSGGQVISNRAKDSGGGVYLGSSSAVFTQTGSSTIAGNTAHYDGGGIYVSVGHAALEGGQIISNTADEDGGGVCVVDGGATLSGGEILSNTAKDRGGGVYVHFSTAAFTQTAGTIAYNSTQDTDLGDGGGGVYVLSGTVTLSGGRIVGNMTPTGGVGMPSGGGVYVYSGTATLSGIQVMSNAARYGGGVYVYHGSAVLRRVQLIHNKASSLGGGVTNWSDGVLTVINTTISHNEGGGLHNRGTAALTYTTVASNTVVGGVGGIYIEMGTVYLKNTIVAHNAPANCGFGLPTSSGHNLEDGTSCGLDATSDISNTTSAILGPLTYDHDTWVHPLVGGSPAINHGLCLTGVTTIDQRGVARTAPCDIGAYEYAPPKVYLPLVLKD